ncbi:hypothetical protein [Geitlerinema sp. PCC 9228]|uniref:hypothetical protein n=1 Tax=Geitlerinema sp. PCC 9228 TaxID=111611 RepID=UPI001114D18A|nr:hypothetical protein [Geitlerinema sp. PCC 9228]
MTSDKSTRGTTGVGEPRGVPPTFVVVALSQLVSTVTRPTHQGRGFLRSGKPWLGQLSPNGRRHSAPARATEVNPQLGAYL